MKNFLPIIFVFIFLALGVIIFLSINSDSEDPNVVSGSNQPVSDEAIPILL